MSDLNMMPFYTDAYLADTTHLTLEEHGAYMKLLLLMWRNGGSLPSEDAMISRFLGITAGRWKKLRPVLQGFFQWGSNSFTQKNLKKIFGQKTALVAKNRDNGKKGAEVKHRKNNDSRLANASGSPADTPKPETGESLTNQKPEARDQKPDLRPSSIDKNAHAKEIFEWLEALFNSPKPLIMAPVFAWLEWGADFESDIKPAAERFLKRKKGAPGSLNWLDEDIVKSIDQRSKPRPTASSVKRTTGDVPYVRPESVPLTAEQSENLKAWKLKMGMHA